MDGGHHEERESRSNINQIHLNLDQHNQNNSAFVRNYNDLITNTDSTSANDFRVTLVNRKKLHYGLSENGNEISLITINKRTDTLKDLMNWLKYATPLDIIKRPMIDFMDEE
jgi:hypothetical protein